MSTRQAVTVERYAGGKPCPECNESKSLTSFSKDASRRDGLRRICRSCDTARYKSGKKKASQIKYMYGLEWEDYLALLEGGCEVCGATEHLHIDHDHACCPGQITCGKCIRGVLCRSHNHAEGHLRTWESAYSMSQYLTQSVNIFDESAWVSVNG